MKLVIPRPRPTGEEVSGIGKVCASVIFCAFESQLLQCGRMFVVGACFGQSY